MKVAYWDKVERGKWKKMPQLNSLISLSDFVVIAIALNRETRRLINLDNICHFKKGSILVNISRGKVIEEESLCVALRQGILSGVGVDVLEAELEDYTKSPLYVYARNNPDANVIITPHIGGATIEAWKKVFTLVFEKIAEQGVVDGHKNNS
jgi:phosphoglycerate dehydrogenase-like enzyme